MKTERVALILLAGLCVCGLQWPAVAQAADSGPGTPAELVKTYASLADGILALKRTEEDLCRSILAATDAKAQAELGARAKAIAAGDAKAAQAALETLAADVGQIATEGDNAVAARCASGCSRAGTTTTPRARRRGSSTRATSS